MNRAYKDVVHNWRQLAVLLLILTGASSGAAQARSYSAPDADLQFRTSGAPPPGFEDLSATQTTQVDLYFDGEFLLSTFVEYDLETVELLDPAEVIDAIPTLLEPQTLIRALTGKRGHNADQLCNRRRPTNCGELTPERVDLLFDANTFRLDLFVHPDYRQVQVVELERYLPPAEDQWALLNNISVTASGRGGDHRFALSNATWLSFGETRLHSRYGVNNAQVDLYEASLQFDQPAVTSEVGRFRTRGRSTSFLSDVDLTGLRIASAVNTRRDLDSAQGTPLLLFLSRRSRVDLLRDGELLDSGFIRRVTSSWIPARCRTVHTS